MGLINTINLDTYFHTLPLSLRAIDVSTFLAVLANKLYASTFLYRILAQIPVPTIIPSRAIRPG